MKIWVLTVSDRAFRGEYEDRSGPEVESVLSEAYPDAVIQRETSPDDEAAIHAALGRAIASSADWIVTTGGTGPSPRDRTPEATRGLIDRELPGIAEALRTASMTHTPFGALSRGLAGMRGTQFIVNLPGSPDAARQGAMVMAPLMAHAISMAKGEGHNDAHAVSGPAEKGPAVKGHGHRASDARAE